MPKNKKHHYVPRFYLKRFSKDGKSIALWNVFNRKKISSANLKNQCYQDYFYGKEPSVEIALSYMEGQAAHLFRFIDRTGVPPVGTEEHLLLVLYVITQYGRTAYTADSVEEIHDKAFKHMFGPEAAAQGIDLSDITVGIEEAGRYALGMTLQSYPLLLDLECKLVINETDVEFVTSDTPVVFYNQLFSFQNHASGTGTACKGLQIFMPISPNKLVIMYDSHVYNVGGRTGSEINLRLTNDVYQLNTLQMCSAYENIYYRDAGLNVEALHRRAAPFRRKRKSSMDLFHESEAKATTRELLVTSREDVRTNLRLSFVNLTRAAKTWRRSFLKLKYKPVVVVRNQQMCDAHEEFQKEVKQGKYRPDEFFEFIEKKYGEK